MDQQPFKIRISLTSKLVLMICLLLMILIGLLNYFAISLFYNDKKAYIYDAQASSATLAGREFVSHLEASLNVLKMQLGSSDLSKPLDDNMKNSLRFLLDNQSTLSGVELYSQTSGHLLSRYKYFSDSKLEKLNLKAEDLNFTSDAVKELLPLMEKSGFIFKNISKAGQSPFLLVAFSDKQAVSRKGYLPIALGYISLKPFFSSAGHTSGNLTILDSYGKMIFHSDSKEIFSALDLSQDEVFKEANATTITSGAKEYVESKGTRMLASFYKPGLDLTVISQIPYDEAMKATFTLTEKFVVLTVGALGIMIIAGFLFARRMTAPIQRLFAATGQISSGQFEVNLPVTSKDEIGALTVSFMAMSRKISDLIEQMLEKMRVEQEVEIAKTVQQSLFPPTLIQDDKILLASHYQSASECGGDWWGYFRYQNKMVMAIADATGHGLPSALVTAAARSCFSVIEKLVTTDKLQADPADILSMANQVVYDSSEGKIMMTYFVGVLDLDQSVLHYASAAHNPPWLFTAKPSGGVKLSSLTAKGQRLGEARDVSGFEVKSIFVNPNDTLVLYTDGLIEGKNLDGEQFGKKRVRKILEECVLQQPQDVVNILINEFVDFNIGKPLDDDVTLAIARLY